MALSPIEIFKKLPKTNCGDCGVPTCMAFAVQLSQGKAELSACPHVGEAAAEELGAASAPPIRPIEIGTGDEAFRIGGETVLFRHEKTFVNPPGIAVLIDDGMDDAAMEARIKALNELQYERVGLCLKANMVAIKSDKPDAMTNMAKKVMDGTAAALMLVSTNVDALKAGVEAAKDRRPVLCGATKDNADAVAELAKGANLPVVVRGEGNLDSVIELTEKLGSAGIKDIIIDTGTRNIKQAMEEQVQIRRQAIKKTFRPLGYPTVVFPNEMTDDPVMEALYASVFVPKYAGIIVLSELRGDTLFPLLVERMNIYTDPQRPMATEPKVYEINNPDKDAPFMVTSNFSLTYFIVSGELESGKMPSYLLVVDTEGLSVLTAWAAGKFAADIIGPVVQKSGIEEKLGKKHLIIPGVVAGISGELEEELPGWEIVIGPREAAHLIPFLKERRN